MACVVPSPSHASRILRAPSPAWQEPRTIVTTRPAQILTTGSAVASPMTTTRTTTVVSPGAGTATMVPAPGSFVAKAAAPVEGAVPNQALVDLSKRLQQRVAALETEAAKLREERDALRVENGVIGEHIYGLEKENGVLHNLGWESQVEKAQLAKQAQGVGTEASQLRLELEQGREQLKDLAVENAQLRSLMEATQNESSQLKHALRAADATIDSVQVDVRNSIERESGLEQRNLAHERQLNALKDEKGRLDFVVSGQHVELANMQNVLKELQAEKARTHEVTLKLQTADMEIQRCYEEKGELDQQISTLHVEASQMKMQRDSALVEAPRLHSALHQQGTVVVDLEAQIAHLQQNHIELQRQNNKLDHDCKSLSFALDGTRKDFAKQGQDMGALQADRTRLYQTCDSLHCAKAEVDSRLSTTASERGLLHTHFEQVRMEKEQLQLRMQQVGAENAGLKSRLVGLEKTVQGFQDEGAALHERLRLLTQEKEEAKEQVLQLHGSPPRYAAGSAAAGGLGMAL